TENQNLTSTFAQGASNNSNNHLRSLNIKASYNYEQTYAATLGYFRTDGSGDPMQYAATSPVAGSPNSTGWVTEFDYMPFNHGGPDIWPWLNMKIGLQYVLYTKFNGAARTTTATAATRTTTTPCYCSIGSRSNANREI